MNLAWLSFNNISAISWRSVSVIVGGNRGIPRENHIVSSSPLHERDSNSLTSQVVVNPTTI